MRCWSILPANCPASRRIVRTFGLATETHKQVSQRHSETAAKGLANAERTQECPRETSPVIFLCCSSAALSLQCRPVAGATTPTSTTRVKPFFAQHCLRCHGEKKAEGDLRIDTLVINFDSPKIMAHWEEIMNRINSGRHASGGPAATEAGRYRESRRWIAGQLHEADAARQSTGGEKVAFRKLSREEYANTIRDLLGVTFDVTDPTGLPEDPDWQGFQRIGSVLTLSPAHVEKYLAAAELVLNEALVARSATEARGHSLDAVRPARLEGLRKGVPGAGMADKVRVDLVPNNGALDSRDLNIKTAGDYIVRVKVERTAAGRRPRGAAASLCRRYQPRDLGAGRRCAGGQADHHRAAHAPAGRAIIRSASSTPCPAQIPEARRSRTSGTPNVFTGLQSRVPWQIKFTDDDGQPIVPFLLLDFVEWEGPLVASWPTARAPADFLRRRTRHQGSGIRTADCGPLRRAGFSPTGGSRRGRPPGKARRACANSWATTSSKR